MRDMARCDLKRVLNQSIRDTTSRFGGIEVMEQDSKLSDDICTVHTTLEGMHRSVLVLYADTALLTRLAQNIIHSDAVTPKDVEDVAKEYFNVVCGRFVAGIFHVARMSPRFQIPSFCTGCYRPQEEVACRLVLNYDGGSIGSMCVAYMEPEHLYSA